LASRRRTVCQALMPSMDEIVDWLAFYNHRRLHSLPGCVSPMQFESEWLAAQQRQAA